MAEIRTTDFVIGKLSHAASDTKSDQSQVLAAQQNDQVWKMDRIWIHPYHNIDKNMIIQQQTQSHKMWTNEAAC